MKILTKTMLITEIAKEWRERYEKGVKDDVYKKLVSLPEFATEDMVTEIIGNPSWTRNYCYECNEDSEVLVMIGEYPYDIGICRNCLTRATLLAV